MKLTAKWVLSRLYSKTCLKQPPKRRPKWGFKTDYRFLHVKSIAECAFCNTFDLHQANITSAFKSFVLCIFEWPL